MYAAKIIPVAIAGPIADRPKPTRLSVPVIFSYLSLVSCLVLVGKGAGDVESCEQGKDVRLQALHHKFKECKGNTKCK
jgi:hypothetical protein